MILLSSGRPASGTAATVSLCLHHKARRAQRNTVPEVPVQRLDCATPALLLLHVVAPNTPSHPRDRLSHFADAMEAFAFLRRIERTHRSFQPAMSQVQWE